jgi:hypothetical protein
MIQIQKSKLSAHKTTENNDDNLDALYANEIMDTRWRRAWKQNGFSVASAFCNITSHVKTLQDEYMRSQCEDS